MNAYRNDELARQEIARRKQEETAARDDLAYRAVCTPSLEAEDALHALTDLLIERKEIEPPRRKRRRSGRRYARREERDKPIRRAGLIAIAHEWAIEKTLTPKALLARQFGEGSWAYRAGVRALETQGAPLICVVNTGPTPNPYRQAIENLLQEYGDDALLGPATGESLDRISAMFGVTRQSSQPVFTVAQGYAGMTSGQEFRETDEMLCERMRGVFASPLSNRGGVEELVRGVLSDQGLHGTQMEVATGNFGTGAPTVRVRVDARAVPFVRQALDAELPAGVYANVEALDG